MTVRDNGAGVAASLRSLLRTSGDDLLRYFERRVVDREDAADLLAETMMTAWRRIDDLPSEDPVRQRMWVYGIAARVLSNHRRSKRRHLALVERVRSELRTSSTEIPDCGEAIAVRDAVYRLESSQRELVMLVHWDGFKLSEAAEILALNASTARSRYGVAKQALREALAHSVAGRPR